MGIVERLKKKRDQLTGREGLQRLEDKLCRLEGELHRLEQQKEQLERTKRDFFEIIQSMESERDWWREAFHTQAREHQTAQAMLVRGLERSRRMCLSLQNALNKFRSREGDKPIMVVPDPSSPPATIAKTYKESMEELAQSQPEPMDGVALRDQIMGPRPQAS